MEDSSVFGELIHSYTRRQAIEDGVLVQLSGPGYQGDDWLPKMVAEAGFRIPLAMTVEAFTKAVAPIHGGELPPGQDIQGRMWDVLYMLRQAIRRASNASEILYSLVVNDGREWISEQAMIRNCTVHLKAVCGPDDDASPCITIMLPDQD